MKKQALATILLVALVISCFAFTSCHKHTVDEWLTTSTPDCTQDGQKEGFCSCGEKLTEILPAIGHDYVNGVCTHCSHRISLGLEYFPYADYYLVAGIGNCTDKDVVIPSVYNNLPVKGIDYGAFFACDSIESVTIPSSVTSIDGEAFYYCSNLKNITIEGAPDIGSFVLHGTAYYNDEDNWQDGALYVGTCLIATKSDIQSCIIKPDTTVIAVNAFSSRQNLKRITIPTSVQRICDYAFMNSQNLTSITMEGTPQLGSNVFTSTGYFGNTKNWENGVLYLGKYLLCAMPEIKTCTIKQGTTSISGSAFSSCNQLESITIPASVTSIGESPFYLCDKLESIDVDPNNPNYQSIDGVLYTKDGKILIQYPGGKEDDSLVITNDVQVISNGAFASAFHLKSITIPDSVHIIGSFAFFRCYNLENITIPTGLTRIEYSSFRECLNLGDITIPASVIQIEQYAFKDSRINVTFEDKNGWYCVLGITNGVENIYELPMNDSPMSVSNYLSNTYSGYNWYKKQ